MENNIISINNPKKAPNLRYAECCFNCIHFNCEDESEHLCCVYKNEELKDDEEIEYFYVCDKYIFEDIT